MPGISLPKNIQTKQHDITIIPSKMKFLLLIPLTAGLDNGLGGLPQMGYNSWYDLQCNDEMNEDVLKQTLDAFVLQGFPQLGYNYFNLDDCIVDSERDENGRLQGDRTKFSSGMRALSDYVHKNEMLFGVYTDRGNATCANRPAALGNEQLDADTYANDWQIDYLKEDSCYADGDHDVAFSQVSERSERALWTEECEATVCETSQQHHHALVVTSSPATPPRTSCDEFALLASLAARPCEIATWIHPLLN